MALDLCHIIVNLKSCCYSKKNSFGISKSKLYKQARATSRQIANFKPWHAKWLFWWMGRPCNENFTTNLNTLLMDKISKKKLKNPLQSSKQIQKSQMYMWYLQIQEKPKNRANKSKVLINIFASTYSIGWTIKSGLYIFIGIEAASAQNTWDRSAPW